MTRPIVVLTNRRDLAADDVIRRVDEAGVEILRFNAEDLASGGAPSWEPESGPSFGPGAVLWRQFEIPRPSTQLDAAGIDDLLLTRAQWRVWLSTLNTAGTPWMNDLWRARRAEDKVVQLDTARSVGFQLPRTLLTNDPDRAREFSRSEGTVIKSPSAGYFEFSDRGFVFTQMLTEDVLGQREAWFNQPMLVQQRVSGSHVRVVTVGGRYFAARCEARALDWRTEGDGVKWRPWKIPDGVAASCLEYVRVMGLAYCAFDFVDDGAATWFLEANQAGEWVFIDRVLDLGIAQAIALQLIGMAADSGGD
jgi:glutathione synthase/RimK-type ligase-like ATP-grasp enzyme